MMDYNMRNLAIASSNWELVITLQSFQYSQECRDQTNTDV